MEIFTKNALNILFIFFVTQISFFVNDSELVYKKFKLIAALCTIIVIIQSFLYLVFKIPINSILLFPQTEEAMINWSTNATRASGFFSEPQTYCSYLLPLVLMCNYKKEYKFSLFICLGLLLSGSSLGIIMVAIVWLMTLFSSSITIQRKIVIFLTVFIGIISFFTLDIFISAREKIFTVFTDFSLYLNGIMTNNHSYSNYLRLIKGWVTYLGLPSDAKIIGIGITNLLPYMSDYGVFFGWSTLWNIGDAMAAYFSSAAGVFVECGLFGGLVYYGFMLKKIRQGDQIGSKIIVLILLQSLFTQIFFNGLFTFYLIFYYMYIQQKKQAKLVL